ncbi:MAG TPA: fused MFS/spermidine synthase [Vicinamibacterales bacterium]|nr:fused MFS/spermidine synthase [Vicinamibacterales bacterium]
MFPILAGLFLLSGSAALVYQVAWLRMLSLVFGVTVYAASAVLTSFMGGLALGSWLGGRTADRSRAPLRAFALLELGIALSALAVPFALEAVSGLYGRAYALAPDAPVQLTILRLLCSGLILLLPTTLMGASLPLLARHVAGAGGSAATRIGWLYAMNTTGGIAGTVLAGFTLIGAFGVTATTRLAAALNIAVGLGALALYAVSRTTVRDAPLTGGPPVAPSQAPRIVLVAVVLAGFAGLALEVVWFRLLTLFLTATTYAFTTMLSTVLLGLAVGSAFAAARVRRSSDPVRALGWMQIWTGVLVLLSMTALAHTYRMGWRTSGMIQACVVAMLPATTLMGATFPFAVAAWLGNVKADVGRRVGVLYALNVCGAVAGSLAGGFILLPWLGSGGSLLLLAAVYVASGCVVAASTGGRARALSTSLAGAALFVAAAVSLPDIYASVLARRHGAGERLVFRAEGVQTTATVHSQPSGRRVLLLDGLHQANDSADMVRVHAEIGQLPMALHPDPRHALVVGVGGGVTAGAVAAHPQTSTDVVELAQSVVSAVPYFAHVNGDLLQRPNVRVRVDDGRNFLRLTSQRYDVIMADLIQPIHAGAGNLYSIEYFTLARRALNEGGLMMQWVGQREEAHYKLIMRTFLQAFPNATLWADGTLMVGSVQPLRFSREAFERQLSVPDIRVGLAQVGLDSFEALLGRYTAGPDEMRRFVGKGPVLTDDRPLLEFHRSLPPGGATVDVSSLRGDVRRHVQDQP